MRSSSLFVLLALLAAVPTSAQTLSPHLTPSVPTLAKLEAGAHLRLAQEYAQRGDSTRARWHRLQAEIATHPSENSHRLPDDRLAERLRQSWRVTDWENDDRSIYTYDSEGRITEVRVERWFGEAVWENSSRSLRTYDGDLHTESVGQLWLDNAWSNNSRNIYVFDDDHRLTDLVFQSWTDETWENTGRLHYAYDSGEQIVEELTQVWIGTDWEDDRRARYLYDADGLLAESVFETWNGARWVLRSRVLYTYDGGLLTERVRQSWSDSDWEDYERFFYTYDGDLVVESLGQQNWNGTGWENLARAFFSYGADGQRTESTGQAWLNEAWENYFQFRYAYDGDGRLTTFVERGWDGTEWENGRRTLYTYVVGTVSEEHARPPESSFTVFPDPSRGQLRLAIDLPQPGFVAFDVYDVVGRRVASRPAQRFGAGEHTLDWDLGALPAGVYVLRLAGAATATHRFTVVR